MTPNSKAESVKIEAYKTLYGLVSNPDTKDMKIRAYESLVYSTFIDKNSPEITLKDIDAYAEKNGLVIRSHLILSEALKELTGQGILTQMEGDKLVLLNNEYLTKFDNIKIKNEKKLDDCDILPVMNDGASYEARLVVVGSKSNEVCSSR